VHYRVRAEQVDNHGVVTLRYDSKLHHIGLLPQRSAATATGDR
jgi:hypothetical protein